MSVSASGMVVDMALGGSYRKKVSDLSPTAWWRLANLSGTTARDSSGNGHHGSILGGVTLGVPATVPDGGFAVLFDGVDGRITVSTISATGTTLTVEFWVAPISPVAAGTVLSNTDGSIRFEITASRFVNVRWSSTDHLSSSALTDAAWSHVVVSITAGSGTIYINGAAAGTFSSFPGFTPTRIGRYDTGGPLLALMDELVLYDGQALSSSDASDHYDAGQWTDVSADVLSAPGLVLKFGIDGSGPAHRVASPGLAEFFMRNDSGNSGGLTGYYSPAHANARAGFTFGVLTRIYFSYSGQTYYRFMGRAQHIDPEPGLKLRRRTRVVLSDIMTDIIETDLRNVTLQVDQQEDDLLLTLMDALPATAQPLGFDLDAGLDTVPYAFDDLGPGVKSVRPMAAIVNSSLGFLYVNQQGTLRYENRQARQTSASSYAFDDDMGGLVVPSSLDGVYNHVRVTIHPRRIDAAATTVLWAQVGAAPAIGAGETVEIWGDYYKTAEPSVRIGGTAQVTPVATTDYTGNAAADGSGTDKTAQLAVTAEFFASTVKFTITNSDAATVYLTKLQCRGKGLYDEAPKTVEASSTQPYGDRPITLDLKYQGDLDVAQDLADYVLAQYEDPLEHAREITFDAQREDAFMLAALGVELGDRVTITESVTGLTLRDLFVQAIELEVRQPLVITCTLRLSPAVFADQFWILEDADSELGVNTNLGFG